MLLAEALSSKLQWLNPYPLNTDPRGRMVNTSSKEQKKEEKKLKENSKWN